MPKKTKPQSLALVCDVETSGLVDNRTLAIDRLPEIIEFYGCIADLDDGRIVRELDILVKPRKLPLSKEIIEITGINDELLENEPPFAKGAGLIRDIVEGAPIFIAHNASFEKDMLEIEFERLGQKIKLPRCVCTLEQTMHIRGHRLSLQALHEYLFGEKFENAHRAKPDTMALLRVSVELRSRGLI